MGDGAYSFSLTTFAPSGKLVQIEYALQAVAAGKTSLGIKAKNGVVIATEKKIQSVLVDEGSIHKVQTLTENIGVTYSGMGPDFRVLVGKGRKSAQVYKKQYGESAPVSQLVREVATVMQEFTQSGLELLLFVLSDLSRGVRPFGVSLLAAGFDDEGPQLYQIDPSGSYWAWKASAIGKKQISAKSFLEKRYSEEMELEDAIHVAILTLKESFEGAVDENNIEIGIVGEDRKFKLLTPAEVKDYLQEVE
jgi:20S proteasome subunit alpha 2